MLLNWRIVLRVLALIAAVCCVLLGIWLEQILAASGDSDGYHRGRFAPFVWAVGLTAAAVIPAGPRAKRSRSDEFMERARRLRNPGHAGRRRLVTAVVVAVMVGLFGAALALMFWPQDA